MERITEQLDGEPAAQTETADPENLLKSYWSLV